MRKYKKLSQAQKISCLIADSELYDIKNGLHYMQQAPKNEQ